MRPKSSSARPVKSQVLGSSNDSRSANGILLMKVLLLLTSNAPQPPSSHCMLRSHRSPRCMASPFSSSGKPALCRAISKPPSRTTSTTGPTPRRLCARSTMRSTGRNLPAPGTISATPSRPKDFDSFVKGYEGTKAVESSPARSRSRGGGKHLLQRSGRDRGDRRRRQRKCLCRLLHRAPRQAADPGAAISGAASGKRRPETRPTSALEDAVPEQCGDGPPPPARDARWNRPRRRSRPAMARMRVNSPAGDADRPSRTSTRSGTTTTASPTATNTRRGCSASSAPWAPTTRAPSTICQRRCVRRPAVAVRLAGTRYPL